MTDDPWDKFPDYKPPASDSKEPSQPTTSNDPWSKFPDTSSNHIPAQSVSSPIKPTYDWTKIGIAPSEARNYIQSLPPEQQNTARQSWADAAVRNYYAGLSETGQNVSAARQRAVSNIPGIGAWKGRGAGVESYIESGFAPGSYEMGKAYEQAHNRYLENLPAEPLLKTPVGDVYTSGLEKAAGVIGGSALMPWGKVMEGTGFLPGAVNTAVNTGLYSTAEGLGESEGDIGQRALHAAGRFAVGVPTGAILGGTLQKAAKQFEPRAAAAIEHGVPNEMAVAEAAERQGLNIPKFLASEGSAKEIGERSKAFPISGAIVRNAAERALTDTGDVASRSAKTFSEELGTGQAAAASDATQAAYVAGSQLRDSLEKWVTKDSKAELGRDYEDFYNRTTPWISYPLNKTLNLSRNLLRRAQRGATASEGQAITHVQDALDRGSLSLRGLGYLITEVGDLINPTILPLGGTPNPALKQFYGALVTDFERSLRREQKMPVDPARPLSATNPPRDPNLLNDYLGIKAKAKQFADEREAIANIIGKDADVAPEGIITRIATKAGSKGSAAIDPLRIVQKRASPEAWNETATAIARQLGAPGGGLGEFSPEKFLSAWRGRSGKSALSDEGKDLLFGDKTMGYPYRHALEDIATVSHAFASGAKFRNPSGTGATLGALEFLGTLGASIWTLNPIPVLGATTAMGINGIAGYLVSRPVTAVPTSQFARSLYAFSQGTLSQAGMRAASLKFSHDIAGAFGLNPVRLNASVNQHFGLGPVTPADHLNHIENGAPPEKRPDLRRQVFEDHLAQ